METGNEAIIDRSEDTIQSYMNSLYKYNIYLANSAIVGQKRVSFYSKC